MTKEAKRKETSGGRSVESQEAVRSGENARKGRERYWYYPSSMGLTDGVLETEGKKAIPTHASSGDSQ